jgi:murein DD-endopeptidase MepM/ murein hydrolase activator NlpD
MQPREKIVIRPKGDGIQLRPRNNPPANPSAGDASRVSILQKIKNAWANRGVRIGALAIGGALVVSILFGIIQSFSSKKELEKAVVVAIETPAPEAVETTSEHFFMGFSKNDFDIQPGVFRDAQPIRAFFTQNRISGAIADELGQLANQEGVAIFQKQADFYWIRPKKADSDGVFFIYKPSDTRVAIFQVAPTATFKWQTQKIQTRIQTGGGIIKTELLDAVWEAGMPLDLINEIENALKWSVDFYHLQPGDAFRVVFEEKVINGKSAGISRLLGVSFKEKQRESFAFCSSLPHDTMFYDQYGRVVRRAFLKAPLQFGRITSTFQPNRKHPVTGIVKPHNGTDFAAEKGTPILCMADGIITDAKFTSNNGNYIKIKHDEQYMTQYLHMNGFAGGIRDGSRVRQGQIIGFVGETGLATGPHVCLRFWKNGVQVDVLKENPGSTATTAAISDELGFIAHKDSLMLKLQAASLIR